MKKKTVQYTVTPIEFPRADIKALAEFDPRTKRCSMNCGPHRKDPRSDKERLFLCDECYTIPKEEIEMKSLEEQVHCLQQTVEQQQAQIDALMLEFCPDKMTDQQKENWAKHQVPADPQPSTKDLSGYEKITSNDQLLANHYYWVRSKRDKGAFFVAPVRNATGVLEHNKLPALIVSGMSFWAYEGNSQALENFEIYGPINEPFHIEVVG